ncbi:MAG TPA: hypothetical protein VGM05_01135 [Planctomycetaceae bacterium]|jgi:hypothetical protein
MSDETPEAFGYLVPLFDKFGGLWFDHEIESCAVNLCSDELAALREAYSSIGNNHQLHELTGWIDQTARPSHMRRGAFVLLLMFEKLGETGLIPFSDGEVRYVRKFPSRDWSRVPYEYQFLGALADQYGIMLYEKGWDDTLAAISPSVRAEMSRAGRKLNESNGVLAVQDWMNAQPESSVEVTALDGLLQLLDNFGML